MNAKITTIAAAALVISAPAILKAQDNTGRFYVHADVGSVFIQDLTIHFSGPSPHGPSAAPLDTHFQPGARGDISIGYNLNDSLAVEIETGAMWNRVDTFNGASPGGGPTDLYQIPLLANLVYRVHLKNGWTPYFGAGAGADFAVFQTTVPGGNAINIFGPSETTDDVAFAYQAQAGISYAISPNSELDFGYQFFGSFEHNWDVLGPFHYDSDKIYTHAVLLSYCWKF